MSRAEALPRAPSSGFTLLEVLVAVAVLGLLYTVLAGVALQGLRAEGESTRRLDASLLADRTLTSLEVELSAGVPPEAGRREEEVEPFLVVTEVTPFDLPLLIEAPEGLRKPASLFGNAPGTSLLRRIDVTVSWTEGSEEQSVLRTTFGLDRDAAAPLLEDAAAAAEAGPQGDANSGPTPGADS
ncbi:MAG: prepilin-type N-terminal cleavage/methylation domain-containing protein [Myxococcota bacterium]